MKHNNYLGGEYLANEATMSLASQIARAVRSGQNLSETNSSTLPVALYDQSYQPTYETQWLMQYNDTSSFIEVGEGQYVMVMDLIGLIVKYTDWWTVGTQDIMWLMKQYIANVNIVGFVLNTDSGGGFVAGTGEFAEFIANCPKPIVVFTSGTMCSAAYWIASGANAIIASTNADCIGSIGGVSVLVDDSKALEKDGILKRFIFGSKSTRKHEAERKMKEEGGEEFYRTNITDKFVQKFHDHVTKHRPNISEEALTGVEIYYDADQALQLGMIDQIGQLSDAIAKVFELAKGQSEATPIIVNQNNTIEMSQNFENIAKVLGVEAVASSKPLFGSEKVELSIENAEKLNEALAGNPANELAELKTQFENQKAELDLAKNQKVSLETAFAKIFETAAVPQTDDASADLAALTAKIAEMAKTPGTTHTAEKGHGTNDAGVEVGKQVSQGEAFLDNPILN